MIGRIILREEERAPLAHRKLSGRFFLRGANDLQESIYHVRMELASALDSNLCDGVILKQIPNTEQHLRGIKRLGIKFVVAWPGWPTALAKNQRINCVTIP